MSDLEQDIEEIGALKEKFVQFIHGGVNESVSTNSGIWPSIPKAINDASEGAIEDVSSYRDAAQAAAALASSKADDAEEYKNAVVDSVVSVTEIKTEIEALNLLAVEDRDQALVNVQATGADRDQTLLDATATAADRVQTGLDVAETNANKTQTIIDATATAADRVQTGLDVLVTNADRTQTVLDATATAADRIQTGLDVLATAADVTSGLTTLASAEEVLADAREVLADTETARNEAQQSASAVTGGLFFAGGWDASTGNSPPTPSSGSAFYRIITAGTIEGVSYTESDEICYSPNDTEWFRVGGSGSVLSVNGKEGIVVLNPTDIGALSLNDAGTAANKNIAELGDASAAEVVLGNDSRLNDARAPTSHIHPISEITNLQSTLDAKLIAADVINTLVSDEASKPLSAAQGKQLKKLIDTINEDISSSTSLDKEQADSIYASQQQTVAMAIVLGG